MTTNIEACIERMTDIPSVAAAARAELAALKADKAEIVALLGEARELFWSILQYKGCDRFVIEQACYGLTRIDAALREKA